MALRSAFARQIARHAVRSKEQVANDELRAKGGQEESTSDGNRTNGDGRAPVPSNKVQPKKKSDMFCMGGAVNTSVPKDFFYFERPGSDNPAFVYSYYTEENNLHKNLLDNAHSALAMSNNGLAVMIRLSF